MQRPLEGSYPYVWLDATFPQVREGGKVQSIALVTVMGVNEERREILGGISGAKSIRGGYRPYISQN